MSWLELVIAAAGATAGYLLKFYLDRTRAVEQRGFRDKRRHYRNLLLCLKSLREGKAEHHELLWFEYSFLWLHAPDSVIRSANSLVSKLREPSAGALDLAPLVGALLLEIRRDMGFRRSGLQTKDFQGKLG